MEREKGSCAICTGLIRLCSGLDFFPADAEVRRLLVERLHGLAKSHEHAKAMVEHWLEHERAAPKVADLVALAGQVRVAGALTADCEPKCPLCDNHGFTGCPEAVMHDGSGSLWAVAVCKGIACTCPAGRDFADFQLQWLDEEPRRRPSAGIGTSIISGKDWANDQTTETTEAEPLPACRPTSSSGRNQDSSAIFPSDPTVYEAFSRRANLGSGRLPQVRPPSALRRQCRGPIKHWRASIRLVPLMSALAATTAATT
jgi:hypothetical protein